MRMFEVPIFLFEAVYEESASLFNITEDFGWKIVIYVYKYGDASGATCRIG